MTYRIIIEATDEAPTNKDVEQALHNLNVTLDAGHFLISWKEGAEAE